MFYRHWPYSLDPAYVAKIEIPESAHENFTAQLEQLPHEDVTITTSLTEKVNWWNPSAETIEVERIYHHDTGGARVILCREIDRWILYVFWMHF